MVWELELPGRQGPVAGYASGVGGIAVLAGLESAGRLVVLTQGSVGHEPGRRRGVGLGAVGSPNIRSMLVDSTARWMLEIPHKDDPNGTAYAARLAQLRPQPTSPQRPDTNFTGWPPAACGRP